VIANNNNHGPNVLAVVQARMGSSRLPGKVMLPINGIPLMGILLSRLSAAKLLDKIILVTSTDSANDRLVEYVESIGYECIRGHETDVLSRYTSAIRMFKPDVVVRVTGDCPLIDPSVVDEVVAAFLSGNCDYASNTNPPTYPDGLDVEVMTAKSLLESESESDVAYDHEHVTPYIRTNGRFSKTNVVSGTDFSQLRWTVDEYSDYLVVQSVFDHFRPEMRFSWNDVVSLRSTKPELFEANMGLDRNQGATMGTGQKLWKRAKSIIPGGNMLLSKRAEMFLPEQWPAYFSRAKGCQVWDLDGNEYIDMSIMGIGTNTLGYGHPDVDASALRAIELGNMSTLNCPEEVYLAEKLVELHPWADMVRLARSGGEANAIAVRIGRAASGRDKVAICGYHGWHDWYLSANLGDDKNLDGHLLPGLEPNGVPRSLAGSVHPFQYNDFEQLSSLVEHHDIGVIKMEVVRNMEPQDGFLQKVRDLATRKGIVLIFDECTSGFRETYGGLHLKYGVEPDVAMFGKTLGNGYAITAVVGRRSVMEAAQSSFISSTFWTERIGPCAALAALQVMQELESWKQITDNGNYLKKVWQQLADNHSLKISQWGLPALAGYTIVSDKALDYKTLITQEMLTAGYLASTSLYASIEHTPNRIDRYIDSLSPIFGLISDCENGRDVFSLLNGPTCHGGFKRLN
jgi:glutamate-1-semialdehyde 2,1-aminomutase